MKGVIAFLAWGMAIVGWDGGPYRFFVILEVTAQTPPPSIALQSEYF